MSRAEFERWFEFYKLQPFDDRHRYQRPAAWIAMAMNGTEPRDSLVWLSGRQLPDTAKDNDDRTLMAFGLQRPKKG